MKILLTGANGQVGRSVVMALSNGGHELVAFNRQALDIGSAAAVSSAVQGAQPDLILNAAAYTAVDRAEEEVEQAYRVNRDGAAHLATAALELAVPLLHISTDYVFDGSREGHYLESDTVSPLGVYGQSKWEGEERVREILPNHLILRTSWVFSPHGNNFVKTILRVAAERSELRVVDDQRGAPTSAAGIAGALLQIAEQLQTEGETRWGTYHFSGNPYVTWYDFALEIVRLGQVAGIIDHEVNIHPIPSSEYPTPVTRPSNSALSCERIEQHFGIVADPWIAQLQRVVETLQSR